ncbi:KAP family NTPase [Mucilaginibacter aquariorum]|uniref:KAP family NTPase n=1 Tax=Mucilaginibacter aquariorum TaxID=2967225 RepID=A0ABT1T188_9SPHI|nr:KAP family NTPase [Mucilaginibacter aquariorum]MCQ6958282.1 KAP family NTPase [Mucilaginibacter aquariorum]
MNDLKDAVNNHLSMKTNGALMITGDWGSGKTHYIKNVLLPAIESEGTYVPLLISVYGDKDKGQIAEKVVLAWGQKKAGSDKFTAIIQGAAKIAEKISETSPFVKKYLDVGKLLSNNGENLLKILPHDKLLICFDDVERMSDKLPINDFLGMVNDLVENLGAKVIIIANAKKFQEKSNNDGQESGTVLYLEKTVEKTVHYTPELDEVFANLVHDYSDADFKKFLIKHKSWILETLYVDLDKDENLSPLKEQLNNIRTVKFALEHFRIAFSAIKSFRKTDDELVQKQLQNVWLFTLAIANELKTGSTISFSDNWQLDEAFSGFPEFDLSDFINSAGVKELDEETDKKFDFREYFKKAYYKRIGEEYIYYDHVFKLITGSIVIDAAAFVNELDEKFYVKDGIVNPAQELLSVFTNVGYYTFSNEEFKDKLLELLTFVESGKLEDTKSYLDAGAALFYFNEFLNLQEEEIIKAIKKGLDLTVDKLNFNYVAHAQFDYMESNLHEKRLQEIFEYIKELVKSSVVRKEEQQIADLNGWAKNDPDKFIKFFEKEQSVLRTADQPILGELDIEAFKEALLNWQPKQIADLRSLIYSRFNSGGFVDRLTSELPFLSAVLSLKDDVKTNLNLTRFTIDHQLLPQVENAIKVLNGFIAWNERTNQASDPT